jgi:hypothetical protein
MTKAATRDPQALRGFLEVERDACDPVTAPGLSVIESPGYRNRFGGAASIDVEAGVITIRVGLRPASRRMLLWHERVHFRIRERFGAGRLEGVIHALFDFGCNLGAGPLFVIAAAGAIHE